MIQRIIQREKSPNVKITGAQEYKGGFRTLRVMGEKDGMNADNSRGSRENDDGDAVGGVVSDPSINVESRLIEACASSCPSPPSKSGIFLITERAPRRKTRQTPSRTRTRSGLSS